MRPLKALVAGTLVSLLVLVSVGVLAQSPPPLARTAISVFPAIGTPGQTVRLRALLVGGGMALAEKSVEFAVDGSPVGASATSAAGVAAVEYTIPSDMLPGSAHAVTASFAGDAEYLPASRTAPYALKIAKYRSAISPFPARGAPGRTAVLRALLVSGRDPLRGKTVAFAVDGNAVGEAVTGPLGVAEVRYAVPESMVAGTTHSITVAFAGDDLYEGSSRTALSGLVIAKRRTAVSPFPAAGVPGTQVTLRALLVSGVAPLAARSVDFAIDGATVGSGTTDAHGIAACAYTIPDSMAPGSLHSITVTFAGDDAYEGSTGTTPEALKVRKRRTGISPFPAVGVPGKATKLRALLVSGISPLAGKTIRFAVDGTPAGSAVTSALGIAVVSYTVPASTPTGTSHSITVAFAGDDSYHGSSKTAAYALKVIKPR